MVGDKADWLVREVRSSDPLDPEIEHFKTTEKKPISPTIDVNVRPMNIPERQAIAIVVKKTRDNTDHGDLELISDQNKLARVLDIMKKVAIVKELFGEEQCGQGDHCTGIQLCLDGALPPLAECKAA